MSRSIWVHGPISLDTVVNVDEVPPAGGFARAQRSEKRIGGSGANIAFGLASTGIATNFITWVGNDALGEKLSASIADHNINPSHVRVLDGPSGEVAIVIDRSGERTIFGLAPSRLEELHIDATHAQEGDIVFFCLWRKSFLPDLIAAKGAGCLVAVGASALDDNEIPGADLVIGSVRDFSGRNVQDLHHRFPLIVLTDGVNGSTAYIDGEPIHVEAVKADSVDATGAGDAFIAGYLASYFHGLTPQRSLEIGALWGAAAVETQASIPPLFDEIRKRGVIEF